MTDNPESDKTVVPPRGGAKKPRKQGQYRAPGAKETTPGSKSAAPAGRGTAPSQQRQVAIQQKRRNQMLIAGVAVLAVVAVIVVLVVVKATGGNTKNTKSASGAISATVPSWVYSGFKGVKASTIASAAYNYSAGDLVKPNKIYGPVTTANGKPTLFYLGAEYCPYCATERWAMVLALSQFGTFSNLHFTRSWDGETSGAPNLVPTFTFYKSTYSSPYINFNPVEESTRNPQQSLQSPTTEENSLATKYDSQGSIPFFYIGGKAAVVGAEYNPALLQPNGTIGDWEANARSIIGGKSPLSSSVYADAGYIISNICALTKGTPAAVCKSFPTQITAS